MWRIAVLIATMFLAVEGQAPDTIMLGTESLSLGVPRDTVIARLASRYDLHSVGTGDSFVVTPKKKGLDEAFGSVGFADGRLTSVSSDWGPRDQIGSGPFARSMFGLLQQFSQEGNKTCVISVQQTQSPQSEVKTAHLSCGAKTISLNLIVTDGKEYGTLTEQLGGRLNK